MKRKKYDLTALKKRTFQVIEVGYMEDEMSRLYDIINVLAIVVNLLASVLMTFAGVRERFEGALLLVESVTVLFFAADYVLRVFTAEYKYPDRKPGRAALSYMVSFAGIVDLLSFLPYYLPIFFPAGAVAFRMFRIIRIFRLFRINAYYDSLNVITEVIVAKKQQLLSSVFIIMVLMLASSLAMYSLENPAQPEVFSNAFSGIWWAASTLLTVGYGDIYPGRGRDPDRYYFRRLRRAVPEAECERPDPRGAGAAVYPGACEGEGCLGRTGRLGAAASERGGLRAHPAGQ